VKSERSLEKSIFAAFIEENQMNWKFWKKSDKAQKPKSKAREWWDAILFAVVAATLIRWLIMEAYTIPTPSMENSLLVGDFLFVSKFHYGTRTTSTPLQIPLTHQKIWFTNIPSYLEWIKLPQYRLPGISKVKREDVVVFNVPPRSHFGTDLNDRDYPVDLKTNYIKRCVAVPGDTLRIVDHQVMINSKPLPNPPGMQLAYYVLATSKLSERVLDKYEIDDLRYQNTTAEGTNYIMFLTEAQAAELKSLNFIKKIEVADRSATVDQTIFPNPKFYPWNGDFYGPLPIPGKDMTIDINEKTLAMYGSTITSYEHLDDVKIENGKLIIDGKEVSTYTFKQNYYFMMGDNRHNSLDSRYWGFVPEDHIVGKAFFIWLSIDRNGTFLDKIRWNRFFKLIR
jgi:signal peptidase I